MKKLRWLVSSLAIAVLAASCDRIDSLDPTGGGSPTKTCDGYHQDYLAAVRAAKVCNAAIDSVQCQHLVGSSLGCGCPTMVNDRRELDRIVAAHQSAHCPIPACAEIACPAIEHGQCVAISSGDVCADISPTAD